jgi:hypothetical protein
MGRKRTQLTLEQILAWTDEYRKQMGRWPTQHSGPITAAPGETWAAINTALWQGCRGLPGGDSLNRLLKREREAQSSTRDRPALTVEQILAWAVAHHRRTGNWPGVLSGAIPEARGESWQGVNMALYKGSRGLSGGDSLSRLLARHGWRHRRR